jgi:hypothetical protein
VARPAQFLRSRRFFQAHFGDFGRSNDARLDQSGNLSELRAVRLNEHEGRPNADASCVLRVGRIDDGDEGAAAPYDTIAVAQTSPPVVTYARSTPWGEMLSTASTKLSRR